MEKLKSCFQVQSSNYNKPLHGTVVSVEDVVECFEVDEFSETLQIPVEFIKKLRIFEFTRNGGRASVQRCKKWEILEMYLCYFFSWC